jgi:hypothetical protein
MTDTPPRIHADDADIGNKLDQLHRWFWPSEVRGQANDVRESTRPVPPLLNWARAHASTLGDHRFVAEEQPDGRTLCFVECGGAFNGYIDPDDRSSNPLVSFDVDHQNPIRLNELVVGAFFEQFAFEPDEFMEPGSTLSDDHLMWTGRYLFVDEPIRVWAEGNRLVLDFGAIHDVPVETSRPKTNPTAEVEAISIHLPDTPHIPRITVRRGVDIALETYRPKPPTSPTNSGEPTSAAAAWSDIYRMQAEMLGFEPTGTVTISWPQLEPLWLAITQTLEPTYGIAYDNSVHVNRLGADIGYECFVTDSDALGQLRTLLQTASEH